MVMVVVVVSRVSTGCRLSIILTWIVVFAAVHEIVTAVVVREGRPAGTNGGGMEWSGEGRAEVLRGVDEMRAGAWSSKAMQRVIKMKVEKRHLFDRLRDAEWKRREEDGGNEREEEEDDEVKEVRSPPFSAELPQYADAVPSAIDVTVSRTDSMLSQASSSFHTTYDHLSSTSASPAAALTKLTASQPNHHSTIVPITPSAPCHRPPSSIPAHPVLTASTSHRPRASPSSPLSTSSPNLSPHLPSLPPQFLHHYHQRSTARVASSDDDDAYESQRTGGVGGGGGGVSESEHSVSMAYSHDVPSLLAPSADDGDGGVDGSEDDERVEAEEQDDEEERLTRSVGIAAIPESDDHEDDTGEDGTDAEQLDSDSGSDGCYERAVSVDGDRQQVDGGVSPSVHAVHAGGSGVAVLDADGASLDNAVSSRSGSGSGSGSGSSSSSSARIGIVLY